MYWYMLTKIDAVLFEYKIQENAKAKVLENVVKEHL